MASIAEPFIPTPAPAPRFVPLEEEMQKKRKARSSIEKLLDTHSNWHLVDGFDVFTLPNLPPGKSEFLEFDPKVLPPNSNGHKILDEIWNEPLQEAFVADMNASGDWTYGNDGLKRWTVNLGLSNVSIGMMLAIRADHSARTAILPKIGRKLLSASISDTVKAVVEFVTEKWPKYGAHVPGEDFLRRFIANCRFSLENEALLSSNLTRCVLSSSRRMSNDEKAAKFTGNTDYLLAAGKPEGKVTSWTADATVETRFNESFLVHAKTHHSEPSGPQTIWSEYYEGWCDLYDAIGNSSTFICNDSHYMCNEVLEKALDRGVKFMSGFDSNKFHSITQMLHLHANKAGEWAAVYNADRNLLVMKRTDHEGTPKFCISNYMVHSRGHVKKSDLHQWDAYNSAYYLSDRLHQQIMMKQHRRWPFRHGSRGHPGIQSHIFDILWCFIIIEDVRVAYRALQTPNIERPSYAPFVLSLAFHMIEKGLKELAK